MAVAVVTMLLAAACGDDTAASDDDASTSSAAGGAGGAGAGGAGAGGNGSAGGGGAADPIPTNSAALLPWLQAGNYLSFHAESAPHASAGPHFGTVRAFINDTLDASLTAGMAEHPQGAAAVKELYGMGDTVLGWSVLIKTDAASAGGQGFYWYEFYNGSVFGDGQGDTTCTGCHALGADFVRSPYPLQ